MGGGVTGPSRFHPLAREGLFFLQMLEAPAALKPFTSLTILHLGQGIKFMLLFQSTNFLILRASLVSV